MWPRFINMLIGLWLMIAPSFFHFDKEISNNDRIVGPLVFTVACIAIFESVRNFRYANIICGVWLLISPWLLGYTDGTAIVNDMISGVFVILLSLIREKVKNTFGGGWRSLFTPHSAHIDESNRRMREEF